MAQRTETVERLAEALVDARANGRLLPRQEADAFEAALDRDAAYAVQSVVCERLGPAVAWKVGRPTPDAEPIMAPVLAGALRPSGAAFFRREIACCGVELEIAFRVDRPLPSPSDPGFEDAVRDCVSPLAAIEICDGRFEDFLSLPPLVKLADNQINGGLVHGERGDGGPVDFAHPDAWLTFNGETVISGRREVPGGDAFQNFLALARLADGHCGGLQPGQIVTTGSLNGLPVVEPGTKIEGWINGLGGISAKFE